MTLVLLLTLLPANTAPPRPVAMVVTCQGAVTLRHATKEQPLGAMDLLRPDDRLIMAGGEVLLVFLLDGHCERLAAKGEVIVTGKGCRPEKAIKREEKIKLTPAHLETLRDLAESDRAAVGVLRGDAPRSPPVVVPMFGATLLTDRPKLSWPPTPGAEGYRLELFSGDGQRSLWKTTTKTPFVTYNGKSPLRQGGKYLWRVSAVKGEDKLETVVDSKFQIATAEEIEKLKALPPLLKDGKTPELLLAAVTYEAHGVYDDALCLYKQLADLQPQEANYLLALGNYYERAGWLDLARTTREQAKELQAKTKKK